MWQLLRRRPGSTKACTAAEGCTATEGVVASSEGTARARGETGAGRRGGPAAAVTEADAEAEGGGLPSSSLRFRVLRRSPLIHTHRFISSSKRVV